MATARPPCRPTSPLALTPLFAEDRVNQAQWAAFSRKSRLAAPGLTLVSLIPLLAAAQGRAYAATWPPGGPWLPHPPAAENP